jgi:hypothetical protein
MANSLKKYKVWIEEENILAQSKVICVFITQGKTAKENIF